MSYIKIAVHAICRTYRRIPFLTKDVKPIVIKHIIEYSHSKKIIVDSINGDSTHLHLLFYLNNELSIAQALNYIKGESSHWININHLIQNEFHWSKKYFAVSVSESVIPRVREYIRRQEEHHKRITFEDEYKLFISKHGFKFIDENLDDE